MTDPGSTAVAFNPFSPEFRANPYPVYHQLRAEDPIHWGPAPTPAVPGCWYVFRQADVAAVLKDARFGRDLTRLVPPEALPPLPAEFRPFVDMAGQWMLFRDPPAHTRLRALVNKAFTPNAVARLRPRIQALADELLDTAQPAGQMDLIASFAFPLPVIVIAEMLGVPAADREQLKQWSNTLAAAIDVRQSMEVTARASQATLALTEYFGALVTARRSQPQDDLLSALVAIEEQGDRLSQGELIAMAILLLAAGHETTVNLIGNGVLALLQHPEAWARLRARPDLAELAVEELLRYDSPVQMTFRFAMEDVSLADRFIQRGQAVGLVLGAANRDPAHFRDPDRLDLTRPENRHIAFGAGIHFCLGAPLARLEGQIAFQTLARRLPGLRLAVDEPEWGDRVALRGLRALPVAF